MADIEEIESIPGQGAQPLDQREQVEPVPGTSRGDQGQVQGEQEGPPRSLLPEGPPKPPLRAQRLSSIEEPTIKEYVQEIKSELGAATKVIQNANYRLNSIDTLVPQISAALAARNKPTGPVVTSLVNQTLSLVAGVDEIVSSTTPSSQ